MSNKQETNEATEQDFERLVRAMHRNDPSTDKAMEVRNDRD